MALLAVLFKPFYMVLKNLRQKVYKYITTTLVNFTLPIQLQDLSTDVNPYIDNILGILSDSISHLYDDDAPQAIRVMEVKKGVKKINIKVDKVKTKVTKIKTKVTKIKTKATEIKTKVAKIKTDITEIKT